MVTNTMKLFVVKKGWRLCFGELESLTLRFFYVLNPSSPRMSHCILFLLEMIPLHNLEMIPLHNLEMIPLHNLEMIPLHNSEEVTNLSEANCSGNKDI